MQHANDFDIRNFLPYLLNRASEAAGLEFQREYKARYGMLRTEWRVLFHLGRYGEMSARDIVSRGGIHKTKVSRAVAALERRRFVQRETAEEDRRRELLRMTAAGRDAYRVLCGLAREHDERLMAGVPEAERKALVGHLRRIARL